MKTVAAKIKTKLVAPNFDFNQSAKLRACIELSATEVFCVLFSDKNELVYLQHFTFKPNEKIEESFAHLVHTEAFFSQNYLSVHIGVSNALYTLVPTSLFQSDTKEKWLTYNHVIDDAAMMLSDDFNSTDSKCVYSLNEKLKVLIDQTFPNNHIKHKTTCLIESLADVASKRYKTCLVHVGTANFDVALYDKKLILFNTFEYQSTEDFLYYILASLEQNKFLIEETELVLAGEIETQSALYDALKDYFPKVKFAVHNKAIILNNDFAKLPNHFYYSLFNLYLCAL
ncbi:MAG: DUF3822 family protein [Bacteroidia bacterium]